jgi:sortase A
MRTLASLDESSTATTGTDNTREVAIAETVPKPGAVLGELQIPRVGIDTIVLEGDDDTTLRRGAGHIPETDMPGEPGGNVGIAAHRDTYFRPLRLIRARDLIVIRTPAGDYRYRVQSTRVVEPDDIAVLDNTGQRVLTLVTCYPFYYVGAAPHRFIVRAAAVR